MQGIYLRRRRRPNELAGRQLPIPSKKSPHRTVELEIEVTIVAGNSAMVAGLHLLN
jgi:hypothetical protein